jgi:hypothetical protein
MVEGAGDGRESDSVKAWVSLASAGFEKFVVVGVSGGSCSCGGRPSAEGIFITGVAASCSSWFVVVLLLLLLTVPKKITKDIATITTAATITYSIVKGIDDEVRYTM